MWRNGSEIGPDTTDAVQNAPFYAFTAAEVGKPPQLLPCGRRSATPTEEGKKIVGIDDLKAISSSDVTIKKIYFSQYLAACTVPSSATKTPHRLSYSELAIVSGAWRRGRRRTPPLRRLGEAKKTGEAVDLFEIKQQIRNQRSCRRLALHLPSRGCATPSPTSPRRCPTSRGRGHYPHPPGATPAQTFHPYQLDDSWHPRPSAQHVPGRKAV